MTASQVPEETRNLREYVVSELVYVQAGSDGYQVPDAATLSAFSDLLDAFLERRMSDVMRDAGDLNLELVRIIDDGATPAITVHCLREVTLLGRGLFCVNFDATNTHHVSAPHPLFDTGTHGEAVTVFRGTGARYLSIATAHRCSNAEESACSGTTSVCGSAGPYRISDMAHTVDSFFQRFGERVHDSDTSARTVQLHGCGSSACPSDELATDVVARLSAGSNDDLPSTEPINVLNTALNNRLDGRAVGESKSCSDAAETDRQLCGTTNTLGRYINGEVDDPCTSVPSDFTGSRFLHIEQNRNLRRDDGTGDRLVPGDLVEVINQVL